MNKIGGIAIYVVGSIVTALAQLFLKNTAIKKKDVRGIRKFLDIRICILYAMVFGALIGNMIAMRTMGYKDTLIFTTLPYVFVLVISRVYFKERIDVQRLLGIVMIFVGMLVYNIR